MDRVISVYKNKFIQRSASSTVFDSFRAITGIAPEDATFADLVEKYLQPGLDGVDAHLLPQRRHLLPIVYNYAVSIEVLYASMTDLLGATVADCYFRHPNNASSTSPSRRVDEAYSLTSEALREYYLECGGMPG